MNTAEIYEDFPEEFVNLSPSTTGIEYGSIRLISAISSHGCQITYYPVLTNKTESLVVSIPECEIVLDTTKNIKQDIKKEVILFAMMNHELIIEFWDIASCLTIDEVFLLCGKLQKICGTQQNNNKIT